ncbi:MAG: polyprenyl synthetase family protein [Rhodovibrionaceae bacterium]
MSDFAQDLARTAAALEPVLEALLPPAVGPRGRVVEAMRYAALGGGKRLRPHLLRASGALFDAPERAVLRAAAALEMVHCYSLIHDDLPAMDDSPLRRGQPSVHKVYGEAIAILAGDALLTDAFGVLADPATAQDPALRGELMAGLAEAAGTRGMVGGQAIDIAPERGELDLSGITELQGMKTGALISFACAAGAILGGAGAEAREALAGYARHLGRAFQIVDDLLDAEGDAGDLGKPVGQDEAHKKATFVGLLGAEKARERAEEEVAASLRCLEIFGEKADSLGNTARFVLQRRS